jgi:hypothetical protein
MSSISEWYAKDGKRMLDSRLTFIEWEEKDTMSVADLWQTSKKFKDYVDDYHVTQGLLRKTDEIDRDIRRLERLVFSIQYRDLVFRKTDEIARDIRRLERLICSIQYKVYCF